MTKLLIGLLALNLIALWAVVAMYRRARKAQKQRIVEAPNSQYKSQYVEDLESKERWERLDLSRLHEVNREEAEKVLAKLRTVSTRGLHTQERAFLDRLVEAERRQRKAELRARALGPDGPGHGTPRPARG